MQKGKMFIKEENIWRTTKFQIDFLPFEIYLLLGQELGFSFSLLILFEPCSSRYSYRWMYLGDRHEEGLVYDDLDMSSIPEEYTQTYVTVDGSW